MALLLVAVLVQSSLGQAQRAIPQAATDAAAYVAKGLEHYQSGRFREAADALKMAAQLKADDRTVYYNLGMSYVQLGRYMESISPFRESLELNPGLAEAYPTLGAVYNYFGQYREAANLLKRAVSLEHGGGVAVYNNLGIAYYHLGRYQDAAEALNRAISLEPELAVAHRNLSIVHQMLGRYKEAGEARARADRLTAPGGGGRSGARLLGVKGPHLGAPGQVTTARQLSNSILIIKDDVRGDGGGEKTNNAETARPALPAGSSTGVRLPGEKETPAKSIASNLPLYAEVASTGKSVPVIKPVGNTSDDTPATVTNVASTTPGAETNVASTLPASPESTVPTTMYRVGVGDVLDIRLLNSATIGATLYPVLTGGLLDYPLASEPVQVTGLTTAEVEARLASKIKIYDHPRVAVGVRDYNSHTVLVSGLVDAPGAKILRREAVPLYVVMADAQPQAEAGRALIMSLDGRHRAVALDDAEAMNTLVYPGDVLVVQGRQQQFFYIGGEVKQPGEKAFRAGITVTQAILIAGGRTRMSGSVVNVARVGAGGLLVTSRYDIRKINSGKILDPVIQPGDRIEVRH